MLLTTLPLGANAITASYGGGPDFLASSSAAALGHGEPGADHLGLGSSVNPSTSGQPVTFTATVFPATGSGETGTVTFFDNGTAIGTASVSNGQATLTCHPAGGRPTRSRPTTAGTATSPAAPPRAAWSQEVDVPRRAERSGEIKQGNPCYIHPEERTLRSEGWAAMSVAIVTGASRGLGEALAKGLARAGWSLVVDGRDRTTLDAAADRIRAQAAPRRPRRRHRR